MANLTSVGVTSGVPTSGTGTVSTIDNLLAVGSPISDGTTNLVAVKAASTAAVATDKALVVAVSPNNTVPVSLASVPSHAVTNAGTFAVQVTSAPTTTVTGTVTANATLAAETTKVIGVTRTADGAGNLLTSTGNALDINIKSGGGSGGTAIADEAAFTAGTTSTTPASALFQTTATSNPLTTGQVGVLQSTANRAMHTNLRTAAGVELGTSGAPIFVAGAGSAGSAVNGIVTVQGIAAMTPILSTISNGTTAAAIKAASTAPVATDPGLVVSISPNSVNANGLATPANSAPVVPSDGYSQYETVAASQTAQVMGATGATGDYLAGVMVFPGTAGCGVVTILDNATTWGTFAGGGTTALPSLVPFMIPVGCFSTSGAWKLTTGANVTAVGIGKFT